MTLQKVAMASYSIMYFRDAVSFLERYKTIWAVVLHASMGETKGI